MQKLIKKRWFYILCIMLFFLPAITERPVSYENVSQLIQQVMEKPLAYSISILFPIAKGLVVFLLVGALVWKNKFKKVFALLAGFMSFAIMLFQNISVETSFGYGILVGNISVQFLVVLAWFYEACACRNNFSKPEFRWWNIVLLAMAFVAFWMPARNGTMYFSLLDLLYNEACLTYCMITPIVLSILLLYYPEVNKLLLRVTSFVGLLFGIMNMLTWFVLNTDFWWMGFLHIPLLITSLTALILSKRMK